MTEEPESWGRPAGQLRHVDHDHKTEGRALLLGGRNWIDWRVRPGLGESWKGVHRRLISFLLPLSTF